MPTTLVISPEVKIIKRGRYEVFKKLFKSDEEVYLLDEAMYLGNILQGSSCKSLSYLYTPSYKAFVISTWFSYFDSVYELLEINERFPKLFNSIIFLKDSNQTPTLDHDFFRLVNVILEYPSIIYDLDTNILHHNIGF